MKRFWATVFIGFIFAVALALPRFGADASRGFAPNWEASCSGLNTSECFTTKLLAPSHREAWGRVDAQISQYKLYGGRELLTPQRVVRLAQLSGGMMPGPGTPHSAGSSYTGPGDVVSGATVFFSCARAYNATYANGTNPLCDLVDSAAPTVVICTLRVATTGFADLTGTYCTGSVTPTAKCAAATGGVCNVKQAYDQSGAGNNATNSTAASQPVLTFSGANSLPGMTCAQASGTLLLTAASFTPSLPYTFAGVAKRTASPTIAGALAGFVTTPNRLGFSNASGTIAGTLDDVTVLTVGSQTENAFHALQYVADTSPNAVIASDGTEVSGNSGAGTPSAKQFRVCRYSPGGSLTGVLMEVGWWATTGFSGGQRTSMNGNMHGANGYNF